MGAGRGVLRGPMIFVYRSFYGMRIRRRSSLKPARGLRDAAGGRVTRDTAASRRPRTAGRKYSSR